MSEHLVYGLHAVNALLFSPYRSVKLLYVNEERVDQRVRPILERAQELNISVEKLSLAKMNQKFPQLVHQGVVALTNPIPEYSERDISSLLEMGRKPCLILILDGVTDPHNLGACLRSADAVGADFVIIPKDKNAGITPVVTKVACGATESIPLVRVTNLARTMDLLKHHQVWIYGAVGDVKKEIYNLDTRVSLALVLGAEGTGMRRLTREHCDELFSLPMLGSVSSLNVSVATGIALYEVVRQRRAAWLT